MDDLSTLFSNLWNTHSGQIIGILRTLSVVTAPRACYKLRVQNLITTL